MSAIAAITGLLNAAKIVGGLTPQSAEVTAVADAVEDLIPLCEIAIAAAQPKPSEQAIADHTINQEFLDGLKNDS